MENENAAKAYFVVSGERYEELIRAEVERDILEAALSGENKWRAEDILETMKKATYRQKAQILMTLTDGPDTLDISPMLGKNVTGAKDAE